MNAASLILMLLCGTGECASDGVVSSAETTDGITIGSVEVDIGDIFDLNDPKENGFLYRLANRLHRTTRSSVIRRQLLFHLGDPLDPMVLAETERLLRENKYLSDAQIESTSRDGQTADVVVRTTDTWSLSGGVSYGRKGGAGRSSFDIVDKNFLGTGKEIVLRQTFEVDRDRLLARYSDRNVFGSRYRFASEVSDNSDGENWRIAVELPFFALDSRRSFGSAVSSDRRITPLYHRGEVVDEFFHDSRRLEVSRGFSKGLIDGQAHRWTVGFAYQRDRFTSSFEGKAEPLTTPVQLTDRTFAYPWVAFERVGDAYLETHNLDRIGRTEDRYLGTRIFARLGLSPRALSDDRSRALFALGYSHTREPSLDSLLDLRTAVEGRWASAGFENVRWTGEAKYYHQVWKRHKFYARLELGYDYQLDSDRQLLLGGDNGLRGYPLRFQDGDRQFLLTLEQRFFTPWSLFQVADVGGAMFFDMGRSWTPGLAQEPGSQVLKDVGLGLRLGLNRSGTGTVLHIDFAVPLDQTGTDISSVQWLVSAHQSF